MEGNLSSTLKDYLAQMNEMGGWCIPQLWNCIEPIERFQRDNGIGGPIAEIGVFHGKFFCGLALTKNPEDQHCAIDCI